MKSLAPGRHWLHTLLTGIVLAVGAGSLNAANKSQLSIYQHGKPVDYRPCGTTPLKSRTAVLMGGGIDVASAYSWMIEKMTQCGNGAAGKMGNLVVIRAGGNPSYDSYIYKLGPLASVVTLVAPTVESANDPALEPYIRNAGAIWLTGGDQGDYYNFWKGTRLERLVSEQVRNYSIPIGGTSAGMMILSQFNYIADPYTITSGQALSDPYKPGAMTLKRDFWTYLTPFPPLLSTVTDSHFDTRDRMGRLIAFMARTIGDKWTSSAGARAIGVNQETALLMEFQEKSNATSGLAYYSARVVANEGANGAAYVLSVGAGSKLLVSPGQALTFTNIAVQKMLATGETKSYRIDVNAGSMNSSSGTLY